MRVLFKVPESFAKKPTTYCPGCTHGVAHRLISELLEEMNLLNKAVIIGQLGVPFWLRFY